MSDSSPLDQAVGRTSASEAKGGAGPGQGQSEQDLHETPRSLWAAVILMCIGAALIGLAIVLFSKSISAGVTSAIAGVVVGLIGAAIGLRKGIMTNVE